MQLGTRWKVETLCPQQLPEQIVSAISNVETELSQLSQDTSNWYWTLTYLEGRPVVQLDDGTTIRMSADSSIEIVQL